MPPPCQPTHGNNDKIEKPTVMLVTNRFEMLMGFCPHLMRCSSLGVQSLLKNKDGHIEWKDEDLEAAQGTYSISDFEA